jgi:hypothetical protein
MVLYIPELGVPVVVPRGTFDENGAMTVKEFDARLKEEMKRRGFAM